MHWFAQALATVTCDQDQPSLQSLCSDQSPQRLIITTRNNCAQSVNDRVACNKDRRSPHSLGKEVIHGAPGRRKMPSGQRRKKPPVHFFRERRVWVSGAKSRLDMPDRELVVIGS